MPPSPSRNDAAHAVAWSWATRLTTVLGLALVVLIGGWSTAHADSDTPGPALAAEQHDAASHADATETVVSVPAGTDTAHPGALGCIVGVVCTLLVLTVARVFRLRVRWRMLRTSLPIRAPLACSPVTCLRPAAPSLAVLSISRT